VAGDVYDARTDTDGGGASLEGLPQYLQARARSGVRVADEPRFAIVAGWRNSTTSRCCCGASLARSTSSDRTPK
jgi:actin-like ATPase involved in cell morphogenesis